MVERLYMAVMEFWGTLLEMSPYLLLGFAVAGVLSVVIKAEQVERHLGGRGFLSILKAALFGIPLPLCSCGVIPVSASLRRHGAGKGAVVSFLLSTPQTGVDSIMVTYSLMGPVFAIFRPLAALISGVVGGLIVELTGGRDDEGAGIEECKDDCCTVSGRQKGWLKRALSYGFVTLPRDIGKSMLVGLAIAGAIAVIVPDNFFTEMIGPGLPGMLFMMVVGIPVYVCATASVPIAVAMMAKGITPGAALVFLIAGPATNAAAVATLWKVLGRRSAFVYMITVAAVAMVSGTALDYIFTLAPAGAEHLHHEMLPGWFKISSAVVLFAILLQAFFKPLRAHVDVSGGMEFKLVGLTCSHCEDTVRRAISGLSGVEAVTVSASSGRAIVKGDVSEGEVIKAVESAGYKAEYKGTGDIHG